MYVPRDLRNLKFFCKMMTLEIDACREMSRPVREPSMDDGSIASHACMRQYFSSSQAIHCHGLHRLTDEMDDGLATS
jgi:hypothetical protein